MAVASIRADFEFSVGIIGHVWIPMADGVRLSARIWLPDAARTVPAPAILEYIPYRKSDGTPTRDARMHGYFAGHGYVAVRVDMRGSGDSEGVLRDEYLEQEQDDALEVIAWIAQQPWCSGKVGMIGKSWGGFNGLQVAARRPPELAAVISVCSTDDRYADDVHYIGGAVLASKMLAWGSTMLAFNALPPDPEVVGEAWRQMWFDRLNGSPPFVEAWLRHQRRDEYWKQGSVCEDFAAVTCPVYAVGGWADAYSNAIPRLLAGLSGPRKGLIGPWGHHYPESGVPGPTIGFLQECLRWWDQWLRGIDTGIVQEPMLRVWMQEPIEPNVRYETRPGRWVAEPIWPARGIDTQRWLLGEHTLGRGPADECTLEVDGGRLVGLDAGDWCPSGGPADLPGDQRVEDSHSLCFDSEPLVERVEVLGAPIVRLALAVSHPLAMIAVRLCDVAPDGSSLLVTRGVLNLTHSRSHEHPTALVPDAMVEVSVALNTIAQAIPAGHRLRIAISGTYWPWVWPAPDAATISVSTGGSSWLELPVRSPRRTDDDLPPFAAAEVAPPGRVVTSSAGPKAARTLLRDLGLGRLEAARRSHDTMTFADSGLVKERTRTETCAIVEGDPLSASAQSESITLLRRGSWDIRIETRSTMTADRESFFVTNTVEAYERGDRVFATTRTFSTPRDLC